MADLWAALALVAILEGLVLFVAPAGWKRMAEQLHQLPDEQLRRIGAAILIAGLLAFWVLRFA